MDNFAFMRDDFALMFFAKRNEMGRHWLPSSYAGFGLIVPCSCCFSDILSVV